MGFQIDHGNEGLDRKMNYRFDTNVAVLDRDMQTQPDSAEVEEVPVQNTFYLFVKRCFDAIASLLVSLVLLFPLAVLALIIHLKDPGNPFYWQERVGKDGKVLRVAKLRSMRMGADHLDVMLTKAQQEQYKKEYKLDDDPRLIGYKKAGDGTKCFGAFLRKTSLDELPQIIWNILIKGDMSVVGPRPILREELQQNYSPLEQKILLSVKPGLTGYWQAYARNNARYEDGKRQKMELYYVHHASVHLDIAIIWATVGAVIKKQGAK